MNLAQVVFGFFVLLAATLNLGFFVGDISDPAVHNEYELFAAVLINLIATVRFSHQDSPYTDGQERHLCRSAPGPDGASTAAWREPVPRIRARSP